jgi:hypothetical protein
VEADATVTLSRGVQGLSVRLARAFNRAVGRRGSLWNDRYHARELRTPREVRNALVYVLQNHVKHVRGAWSMDDKSSAAWFGGWSDDAMALFDGWARGQPGVVVPWTARGAPWTARGAPWTAREPEIRVRLSARAGGTAPLCPVVPPATWLATEGWRTRSGLGAIRLGECPAGADGMRPLERAARSWDRAARAARFAR